MFVELDFDSGPKTIVNKKIQPSIDIAGVDQHILGLPLFVF